MLRAALRLEALEQVERKTKKKYTLLGREKLNRVEKTQSAHSSSSSESEKKFLHKK